MSDAEYLARRDELISEYDRLIEANTSAYKRWKGPEGIQAWLDSSWPWQRRLAFSFNSSVLSCWRAEGRKDGQNSDTVCGGDDLADQPDPSGPIEVGEGHAHTRGGVGRDGVSLSYVSKAGALLRRIVRARAG